MTIHPDDKFYIILDAVASQRHAIENDGHEPWTHYDAEPGTDPKVTEAGYLAVLNEAEAFATQALDTGRVPS
jgi:hypothetical protein